MMTELRSALFRALEKSDLNMLRAVLAQGVSLAFEEGDVDPVCFVGMTNEGLCLDTLKFLHEAGADLTVRESQYQDTLLHWAVNNEEDDLLPWLIQKGLDINAKNSKGRTPLVFAAHGLFSMARVELSSRAMRDVRRLVEAGADINVRDNEETLLHKAVQAGTSDLVSYLLTHGANPNVTNTENQTPLHAIALLSNANLCSSHLGIIDQLIQAGADLNALDEDGHSPLTCTNVMANKDVARKLINLGADVNSNSGAPLRAMMTDDVSEIFDLLVANGAILDTPHGSECLSPIGLAANNNCLHAIAALIDHGINVDVENIDGETALLIGAWHGHYDAVALLLSRGANPDHSDNYGNTALSWAERRKDTRLVELLRLDR